VRIHALRGEPQAWTAEAKGVMAQLERWRGLAFKEDVVVELREAAADGPAGWYEPSTKRLVVTTRGTERFGRGVMLHELFHALQDQQFDLSGLHGAADGPDADRALRGLIEGEAMLAVQELMDYDFAKHAQLPAEGPLDEARFEKVFHYGDGLQFVLAVRRAKGWEGVAAAFERPPRTTAELYHPDRWLAGWSPVGADAFARPVVGAGDAVVGNAPAGEYALRLLLARVPATRARAATLGSALQGDLLQSVKTAGGTVRHTWQLRLDGEAAAALEKVAATAAEAIPGALARSVSVTRQGQTVTIGWATKAE
jgi:hypothetical protein